MAIEVEAIYEDGVLKLEHPLPLAERQRVKVVIAKQDRATPDDMSHAERLYGMVKWTGDAETARRIAEDPEFGIMESP